MSQITVSGSVCRARSCRKKAAFVKNEKPKAIAAHSRRMAEAHYRLAGTEEALGDRITKLPGNDLHLKDASTWLT